MTTLRATLSKGAINDWPSLQLLEFTVGLARRMQAKGNLSQAELARRLNVSPSYISSVLSGNENLTVETMSRIAAALDSEIHIAVTEKGEMVRWERDVLSESERAPDLSVGHAPTAQLRNSTATATITHITEFLQQRQPVQLASSEPSVVAR
jgi:transcriptional regulator with XRE-family HTH domain